MIFLVNTCPSKDSSSRFSMNHTPQLPIHAHVHFVIIFKFLISHQLLFLPSNKTWKDQISDIDAGYVNKTYHDLSITGICDEMDVPLWSECRQRNVIRQRILIRHKKEITSALIWKKRAAVTRDRSICAIHRLRSAIGGSIDCAPIGRSRNHRSIAQL